MARRFSEKEIQECIQFHKDELDKIIGEEEAVKFLEEMEERDTFWQEMSDLEWEMERAHHEMGLKKSVK